MTVDHVPASSVSPAAVPAHQVRNAGAMISDEGASIVCTAADRPPVSKDATYDRNVHCSGYNVWA